MPEEKRKTRTSVAAVNRYNTKTYDVLSVRIPKELASAFKQKCSEKGDSQASVVKKAIEAYLTE